MTVSFGDCIFDGRTRQLSRRGAAVHISPKVFRLLELLLAQRPAAVSKESLMESLWPGIFVAEGNLARLVAELRETIGDDANAPRFVRTVPRFGYAFHGDVLEAGGKSPGLPAPPSLYALVWGDREIPLTEGEYVLGRDPDSDIPVDHTSVSRHHARIVIDGTAARLEDLGSKNGTFLRNQRLEGSHPLRDGDTIRLGLVALVFRRFEPGVSTETVATTR